ncbi:MAG: DUF2851 family protein [Ignavibacteria bacterium]|nr:DUF2851 family protein [Ignavibacteria bacterium]
MSSDTKIKESILYNIWFNKEFSSPLISPNGEEIEILDSGTRNEDSGGPDFKNARLRIGNLTYVGDIELDRDFADWKNHGHNIDAKYNSLILHAALFNKFKHLYVYTRNGRKVPSVCLSTFINSEVISTLGKQKTDNVKSKNRLKCFDLNSSINESEKQKLLMNYGIQRYNKKCKKIFNRLKEIHYVNNLKIKEPSIGYELPQDFYERQFKRSELSNKESWQQLLYELIFEGLGYSKNKTQMNQLAQLANVNFLRSLGNGQSSVEKYETALLNIAGLIINEEKKIDDESHKYLEQSSIKWGAIKEKYDNRLMDSSQWHFFRLRPQNFPTIRIAAGAIIVNEIINNNLIGVIAKKLKEIHNLSVLVNSLRSLLVIKANGFWKTHYVIGQKSNDEIKYFVGIARSDELVVNVVLPFFSVYFEIFEQKNLSKKILKMYSIYEQKSDNQILSEVSISLDIKNELKRTVISQGMIELFRNYCSKNKCLECEIGKIVFN